MFAHSWTHGLSTLEGRRRGVLGAFRCRVCDEEEFKNAVFVLVMNGRVGMKKGDKLRTGWFFNQKQTRYAVWKQIGGSLVSEIRMIIVPLQIR